MGRIVQHRPPEPPGSDSGGAGSQSRRVWVSIRRILAPLENSQYRWLLSGNLAFFLAMQGQMLVRSIITFELTDSALALGLVNFSVAIPMMLASPFGGVVADRIERRRLILLGQGALIVSEVLVLTLFVTGLLQFWHLVVTAMVMGTIFPFTMPARAAIVVDIVGKRGLQSAMALSMGGMNATRILGPTFSGFLIPLVGVAGSMAFGVSLYVLAFLSLFGVDKYPPPGTPQDRSVWNDLLEGFRYVGQHRVVFVLLLFGILPMFLAMPFQTLLVIFTEEVWSVGASGLGILYALAGAGGLAGSIFVAQRSERRGRLQLMLASVIGFGFFLMVFAGSPWFLLALPMVFIANVCSSVFTTLNNTAIQLLIPDRVRGRISSFLMMSFGVTPLGTLPMSYVAEHFGAPIAVSSAAVLVIAVAILFVAISPALRSVDSRTRDSLRAEERDARRPSHPSEDLPAPDRDAPASS